MPTKSQKPQTDMEWAARTLCSDGACIGVIGPDGHCLECGRLYDGELPDNLAATMPSTDMAADDIPEDDELDVSPTDTAVDSVGEPQPADDEWAARKLCSDGSCIGVIGPDGRCLECGRASEEG